jgi:HEPN domain-containing protein
LLERSSTHLLLLPARRGHPIEGESVPTTLETVCHTVYGTSTIGSIGSTGDRLDDRPRSVASTAMTLLDGEEFERWRGQSSATRDAARVTAEGGSWSWSCFLSEQAAQYAVKGLLHGIGEPNKAWGHDLLALVNRAAGSLGGRLQSDEIGDAAVRLARHYIATRYPDAHASGTPADHYRQADATAAGADCDSIIAAVDDDWRAVNAADTDVGHSGPADR